MSEYFGQFVEHMSIKIPMIISWINDKNERFEKKMKLFRSILLTVHKTLWTLSREMSSMKWGGIDYSRTRYINPK